MKKNWLARAEMNAIRARPWARAFRRRPLVPDSRFQDADEPYPGHWRRFPDPWPPAGPAQRAAAMVALNELPDTWRRVLQARDVFGRTDAQVAADLGLSIEQVRDILSAARAAVLARRDGSTGDRP